MKRFCICLNGRAIYEYDFDDSISDDDCCEKIWDYFYDETTTQKEYE